MVKSATVTVTAAKKKTILIIDAPEPAAGMVPFNVDISGQLTDMSGGGIGGKVIKVYLDGSLVGTPWTNANPAVGWIGIWWHIQRITTPGIHTIYAEFAGDAEWEGCDAGEELAQVGEFGW